MHFACKISPKAAYALYQKSFPVLCLFFVQGLQSVSAHNVASISFQENRREIVINEIMADPSPAVGLPDAEYVELYNRSTDSVDLSGWLFSDAVTSVSLPAYILPPGSYVVLCHSRDAEQYARYGRVLPLTSLPALNNPGDVVTLRDNSFMLIDSLTYTLSWYRDTQKAEGGWSLERIDPNDFCGDGDNWMASVARDGGTPGAQNSVFASRPDNRGPGLVSVAPMDRFTLRANFSEKLGTQLPAPGAFKVRNGPSVIDRRFYDAFRRSIVLMLSAPLTSGNSYELTVSEILDCSGNRIDANRATTVFFLPDSASPGDIAVNEVLFNPRPTGVDFVEVINRSAKVIDIRNWSLRNALSASERTFVITPDNMLVHPGQYLVFTVDPHRLKGEYVSGVEDHFFATGLPPLNDREGAVALLDARGVVIDSIRYSDDMHAVFLKDDEGVSLERISTDVPGHDPTNWRSASSVAGFATPGYVNSNARPGVLLDAAVVVEPEVIQPKYDFARIRYQFQTAGTIANIGVFDHRGRKIRTIAENALLGVDGFFRWDADTDEGHPAASGYYMVWFEVFDNLGNTTTFRNRVAVF